MTQELKPEWGYLFGRPLGDGFLVVMPLTFGRARIAVADSDGHPSGEFY